MKAPPPTRATAVDAYTAFLDGQEEYSKREYGGALEAFDAAIDWGYVSDEAYSLRAVCLQRLKFNREAIHDLRQAIALEPHDCNLYFLRSNSKLAIRDYDGAIADLRIAMKLSRFDNALNRMYDELARRDGFRRISDLYEKHLMQALLSKAIERQELAAGKRRALASGSNSKRPASGRSAARSPAGDPIPQPPATAEIASRDKPHPKSSRPRSTVLVVAFAIAMVVASWQSYWSTVRAKEVTTLRAKIARQAETIQWQAHKLETLGAVPKVEFRVNPIPINANPAVEK